MDNFHTSVSLQARNKADDGTTAKEDKAYYAGTDLKDALAQVGSLAEIGQGAYKKGLVGFAKGATADRLNTIQTTAAALISGKAIPPKTAPPPSAAYTLLGDEEADELGAAPGPAGQANLAGKAKPTPLAGSVEEAAGGAKGAEQVGEIESSGLGTKIVKSGLKYALGDKVGEAGLSAISEVGGKALGDFSGVGDIAEGFKNLAEGGSFFKGDTTGDKFAEAGAVFDLAGTAFPPLEAIGGALNFVSAIDSTKDALKNIYNKKVADGTKIIAPLQQQMKISPTFSSLGLVASAPMSAKQSIVGSGTF
tara:strand:- start:263 stop:1183 length:921 start_codon:yes stop_codon:yes gene_type:complete